MDDVPPWGLGGIKAEGTIAVNSFPLWPLLQFLPADSCPNFTSPGTVSCETKERFPSPIASSRGLFHGNRRQNRTLCLAKFESFVTCVLLNLEWQK